MTNWGTPQDIYDRLDKAMGGFAVDAAADATNHLHGLWYGPGSLLYEDAFAVAKWLSPAFCNPPYDAIDQWTEKFAEQQEMGVRIAAILPARTGTKWWRQNVVNAGADIIFLTGRIAFIDPAGSRRQPNHDSAYVLYGPSVMGAVKWVNR